MIFSFAFAHLVFVFISQGSWHHQQSGLIGVAQPAGLPKTLHPVTDVSIAIIKGQLLEVQQQVIRRGQKSDGLTDRLVGSYKKSWKRFESRLGRKTTRSPFANVYGRAGFHVELLELR